MADNSAIEWTEATWSPVTGCDPISPGCKHCYAKREVETRWSKNPKSVWYGRPFNDVRCHPEALAGARSPLTWKRPRRIFVCPRADLFHDNVPVDFIRAVFDVMAACPQHTFQVLTKRAARMQFLLWSEFDWTPLPNIQIGVSVEDQAAADERIPLLLQTPAAMRWVSAEPLLGPVSLGQWIGVHHHPDNDASNFAVKELVKAARKMMGPSIDWCIVGGESGPKARSMHPNWARSLRDQCAAAGVPFLFKQWGEWLPRADAFRQNLLIGGGAAHHTFGDVAMARVGKKAAGRLLDGVLHDEYPEVPHA
ncbi:MAG: phage Gp37/Gp68 family protein [Denitratisoma sp.]|nr:phage Gp37/Gp68 family protein [Denitratisoma sp.]